MPPAATERLALLCAVVLAVAACSDRPTVPQRRDYTLGQLGSGGATLNLTFSGFQPSGTIVGFGEFVDFRLAPAMGVRFEGQFAPGEIPQNRSDTTTTARARFMASGWFRAVCTGARCARPCQPAGGGYFCTNATAMVIVALPR